MKTGTDLRVLAIAGAGILAISAFAQTKGDKGLAHGKKPVTSVKATDVPVSEAEAAAVFAKAESVLRKVIHVNTPSKLAIPKSTTPVTRTEVVREMNRLYELAKPTFKFTPLKVRFDSKLISIKDPSAAASLKKLVGWGFVGPVGPLVTSPKDSLTVPQFGDAVGYFLARMSELTHTPSIRWSPYLQSGG